jgi:hypothetical protein
MKDAEGENDGDDGDGDGRGDGDDGEGNGEEADEFSDDEPVCSGDAEESHPLVWSSEEMR